MVCWDHSVGVGPEALGMMGCQEMTQPGRLWADWFCPCELDLVLVPHPVLVLLSLLCGQHSLLFFSLAAPTLAICLLVFAVGLKLEGFWADWYKPVLILGGHMAVFPPSGSFQASFSTPSSAPGHLSCTARGIPGPSAGI